MAWDPTDREPAGSAPVGAHTESGGAFRAWSEPEPVALGTGEPRRRRRAGWLIGLGVVVCVLVAAIVVMGSSHNASASKLVLGAPERNAAAGPVHFTADVTLAKDGSPLTALQMTGDEDSRARTASITINAGPTTAEIRLIDGIEYFSSALAELPAGKSWVKIDPAAVGITPAAAAPNDPMAQLQLLGGLVGEPIRTGTDTIDGTAVTRYDVTLDFTTIFDKLSTAASALGESDSFIKGLKSLATLTDLHHVPGHVALDDQGRARAFNFALHIAGPKGTIDESIDMRFTDFGKSVTVELPPADQTVPFSDVPDVFKKLTGG
jgi:hypothetical protein